MEASDAWKFYLPSWPVLGYVASGRVALGSIRRGHLDLGHLPAIVVTWFLELYLLS